MKKAARRASVPPGTTITDLPDDPLASLDDDSPEAYVPSNPTGLSKVQSALTEFIAKPFDDQRKDVDQRWLELAYVLPTKALRLALTGSKADSSRLQQIVTAAAIAKDKRFPTTDDGLTVKIPARMLASYSCAIILKPTPQPIDIQAHVELRNENEIAK